VSECRKRIYNEIEKSKYQVIDNKINLSEEKGEEITEDIPQNDAVVEIHPKND
jgi:hypothetical protein